MKSFLKYTLASCLGITIALVAFSFFIFIFFVALFASFSPESKVTVRKDSILTVELKDFIPELSNNIPSSTFNFSDREVLGYRDMIRAIDRATEDENIVALQLKLNRPFLNVTSVNEMMESIKNFSESGKPVFVHNTFYSQVEYYLASTADHISLNPFGSVDFRGFGIIAPFLPDFLDKLGVNFNIYFAGDYKGAGENFNRREFSPENREQIRDILDKSYDFFLSEIAANRNLNKEDLRAMARNFTIRNEYDALSAGLVDAIEDAREFERTIKLRLGKDEDKDLRKISIRNYHTATRAEGRTRVSDQVAIIYAEGNIMDGKSEGGLITDGFYVKAIESIAENENIKAVVLRINSGGGSVIASENIYRALLRLQESGKPLVVSMGDVAASGGYYIATPADKIFAEPQTITGSIGVFYLIPSVHNLVRDKMDIHFDTIATSPFAVGFNQVTEFTDQEHEYFQQSVENTYDRFLNLVAESRGMSHDEVLSMAEGRIWMAEDALNGGLIDQIGGLKEALAHAVYLAGIDDYRLREFPQIRDPFIRFLEELTGESMAMDEVVLQQLSKRFELLSQIEELKNTSGLQARMPYKVIYR